MIKLKQLLGEVVKEDEMYVRSDEHGVAVMHKSAGALRGSVVSIDHIRPGEWWVSRALVNPEEREQGIGSALLTRAVQEVMKREPQAQIIAEPGGTYGSDEKRQINFYVKNGFVELKDQPGVVMYKAKS